MCFGLHNRKSPKVDSKNEKNTRATKTEQQNCSSRTVGSFRVIFLKSACPFKVYDCPEWGKSSEDLEDEGEASPVEDLPDAASTNPMEWTWDMPLQDGFILGALGGACGLVVASVCDVP